jgi:catechol 2,3-dioxygenase-like lactoylglutathione lyase family enzyme
MDMKLELVIVPVSDVDRSKAFYSETLGFNLDVDHQPNDDFRVVQLTPPGSACSITIGKGLTDMTPGCIRGLHLVVSDIEATCAQLAGKGVELVEMHHFDSGRRVSGPHPKRGSYETFSGFSDPDGNVWVLQEVRR